MATSYIVKQTDKVGRYVEAGRDLAAGEEILCEYPFSIGPKSFSYLLCLGCCTPLVEINLCTKCSWPVCSDECSENPWHKNYECEVFSKNEIKFQEEGDPMLQLDCITPLRTLLEAEKSKDRWESEIVNLESHDKEREKKDDWREEEINIVNFLRDRCKLAERFSSEVIHKVCGILEVNAFEVVSPVSSSIRGLYPKTALLNHNCVANTTHSIFVGDKFKLQLRTTVDVKSGNELFSSYTSSLYPTIVRRIKLRQHKYFDCNCPRCSDPKELGTNIGTLKCTKCDNGIITSTNPLDDNAPWKCSHCENGITGFGVQRVYMAIQSDIDQLEQMAMDPERLERTEKILRGYKSVLHPHNGFNAILWHSLSQMYGHIQGYTLDMLPDLLLERKSKFCKDLLDLLNVVEPGYTRIRGLTLYEYHVGELLCTKSRYQNGEISIEVLRAAGKKIISVLEECAKILSLEPDGSPEAMVANTASVSIDQLKESVLQLQ